MKRVAAFLSHASRRIAAYFQNQFHRLMELRDTPHAIAGGAAIGMFWGFTPLFGVKTLLSLGTAWLARCSKIAAVIAVCLHDIVTPLWPVLFRLEYDIGFWILSHPHRLPPKFAMHHIKLGEMLEWTTFFHIGLPLLIGSLAFAIPAAAASYVAAFALTSRRARHKLPPSA